MASPKGASKPRKGRATRNLVRQKAVVGEGDEAHKSGDYSRAIIETIHEALVVVDAQFRALSVNRGFCDLFHVSPQEMEHESILGPGGGQFKDPSLRAMLQDVLSKGAEIRYFEVAQEFARIGRRYLVLNAHRIETSQTVLIAVEDITERKQAQEQELRILRAFVEQAPMAVIMLNRRMLGVQVSQHWLDDMCMTREQVLGRSHYECFPDLPAHWEGLHRRSLAGESLSGHEESYVRPDGRVQCVNWRMVPWGDSGETTGGVLISYEDVTQRKHAEEEARQSAATIRSLIESAPQAVIAVSEDETIMLANGNTEAMFGYKREELLGQPLAILLPESGRGRHAEHHKAYIANMQNRPLGLGLALKGRRRDGTTFPVEIGLSAIETASGKLAVAFVADITQRKRLEESAKAHAEQVQALAARLMTAQEDERRRVSRELHDQICQQLASLAIDIGGLASNPPSLQSAPSRLKALQGRVVKASEEVRHIAHELHPSMLDDLGLATSLRALCQEFSAKHLETELRFSGGAGPKPVPREVASCVYRIAQESLQNIAKHSKAKHVSIALGAEKGAVSLTIVDDGAGFDLETVKGRGGLGLIGMEERVKLLKGKLIITTRPGHGTRIVLIIPVSRNSL